MWVDYWARVWSPDCNLGLEGEGTPGMPAYDENREAAFDQPARHEVGVFYAACLRDLQGNVSGWPVEWQAPPLSVLIPAVRDGSLQTAFSGGQSPETH